jgi:uncharacterized lipoprotein NlpE involved in copper resistance
MPDIRTRGASLKYYTEYGSGTVQYRGKVDTGEEASVYVPKSWLPEKRPAEIQIVVIVPGQ